jgi:hypothetical protein
MSMNRIDPTGMDPTDTTGRHSIFSQIREGMDVYDRDHNRIGAVDFIHFGAASEYQQMTGTGPATPGPNDQVQMRNTSWLDIVADAFHPDTVPDELSERLMQNGFIRLDTAGLFARDRFILPEQISGVSRDGVLLNTTRDRLVKRT